MGKNLFAGIGAVSTEDERLAYWGKAGADGARGKDDGKYLVSLDKFTAFESEHPDTEGQPTFVTEVTIEEVLESNPDSPEAGERRSFIQIPAYKPNGSLTEKGARAMGRVKIVAAAILNVEDPASVNAEMCGTVAEGDGTGLAGTKLIVTVATKPSGWTDVFWAYAG